MIYSLVNPKYAIPIHGEFKHRKAAAGVLKDLGYDKDHILMLESGDVLAIDENGAEVIDKVPAGTVFVDGLGIGDVGNIVMHDRRHLAENGIVIVVMSMDSASGQIIAGPDMVSRGFIYVRESENLMEEAQEVLNETVDRITERNITDWGKIKSEIKDNLGSFLWKKTRRNPMIIPIIMDV